jgi:1,2-phenylacetyl-CoA epoxidase catalytic subunit
MIEKILAGVLPVVLQKVAAMPIAEKQFHVSRLAHICMAYEEGDRESFDWLLKAIGLPDELKAMLSNALWSGYEDQSKR